VVVLVIGGAVVEVEVVGVIAHPLSGWVWIDLFTTWPSALVVICPPMTTGADLGLSIQCRHK
jgi:hypothetical protein